MSEERTQESGGLSRADFLKRSGAAVGGVALGGVAATPSWARLIAHDAASTINIGIVSPLTGPEAGFGEPDPYVVGLARTAFAKGLKVGGKHVRRQDHREGFAVGPRSGVIRAGADQQWC